MTKSEKLDKKLAMDDLNIPSIHRSPFMRFANKWGRFNLNNDQLWYEWSPLEDRSKATMTMSEMWDKYVCFSNERSTEPSILYDCGECKNSPCTLQESSSDKDRKLGLNKCGDKVIMKNPSKINESQQEILDFIKWAEQCGEDAFYIFDEPEKAVKRYTSEKGAVC